MGWLYGLDLHGSHLDRSVAAVQVFRRQVLELANIAAAFENRWVYDGKSSIPNDCRKKHGCSLGRPNKIQGSRLDRRQEEASVKGNDLDSL
jgi:hypothetical protein